MAISIVAALLPVLVFLAVLLLMDSFKLVPLSAVLVALLAGALSALAALALHSWLLAGSLLSAAALTRYVGPVTEEVLKAVYVVVVLRRGRLGFLVDAALVGFSVGTGFALVENIHYLGTMDDARLVVWLVRGFGPALLHGAMTGLFAILLKSLSDRYPARGVLVVPAALLLPIVVHSVFNHFPMPAEVATCVLLVLVPVVVTYVFGRSERATREWVGEGLDLDVELLNLVTSAHFGNTRLGKYLAELKERFPGPVVADMFCLLRVELELAIRAKGMLMAREAGLEVPVDPDVRSRLRELRFLQGSIGPTGLLALKPLRVASHRDDWHTYLLEQAGEREEGRVARAVRWLRRRFVKEDL